LQNKDDRLCYIFFVFVLLLLLRGVNLCFWNLHKNGVDNMGCTPALCYSDVVRGIINSRGILPFIALYNGGICADARTF
jgi:hypothetical protein